MSDNPLDGITYHDVPLQEKLKAATDQECSREFEEEVMEKKNLMAPIHAKPKYKTHREKNSMVKELTQKEINREYLSRNLKTCKTQKEFVICMLLSGQTWTNKLLFCGFKDQRLLMTTTVKGPVSAGAINVLMTRLQATKFGKYIVFSEKQVVTGGKRFNIKTYQLSEEALNLRPEEAFEMTNKRIAVEKKVQSKPKIKIVPSKDISSKSLLPSDYMKDETPFLNQMIANEMVATTNPPISLNLETSKEIKNVKIYISKTESGGSNISINFD